MIIRDATQDHAGAITAIYGHHVLHGLGTFEESPPPQAEMVGRIGKVQAVGLPYLVAADDSRVLGFAYAGPFRPRAAYRYTVEDSVYVSPDAVGHGVGRALLAEVISRCEQQSLRQMIAVIGDSANAASVGLHAALGFVHTGIARNVGFKHDQWVDIVFMQRTLTPVIGGRGLDLAEA